MPRNIKQRNRNIGIGQGSSSVGAISYDAQSIKNKFFAMTGSYRNKKKSGDGGYWTGGRCEWGAGHSLDEDIQKLVGTFNKTAEMSEAIASLKECSSSSEFLAHKNALLTKSQQARAEMSLQSIESNTGAYSGLCIIWTDYTATFLTPYITAFANDLDKQAEEISSLNYEELEQLETLQLEEQQIKGQIEDNYRQAQEAERDGDTQKAAELYQVIKGLKSKHEQVISQIMNNSWNKVSEYNFTKGIEQIMSILEGKINPDNSPPTGSNRILPNNPYQPTGNPNGNGSGTIPPNNPPPQNPWQPNQTPASNTFQLDQQTLIIMAGVIVVIFFLMNQKNQSRNKYDYDY